MTSLVFFYGCEQMDKNEDDYGIAISENDKQARMMIENVEWSRVVEKIQMGKIDDEVIVAMSAMDIPQHYDKKKLQERYLQLYEDYLKEAVENP